MHRLLWYPPFPGSAPQFHQVPSSQFIRSCHHTHKHEYNLTILGHITSVTDFLDVQIDNI